MSYLIDPLPLEGYALGMRVSLQVSRVGADPPMLGVAVERDSLVSNLKKVPKPTYQGSLTHNIHSTLDIFIQDFYEASQHCQ